MITQRVDEISAIKKTLSEVSDFSQTLSESTDRERKTTHEVFQSVERVNHDVMEFVDQSDQLAGSSETLKARSQSLLEKLRQFKLQ
jgi:methyl-accepting chemotaxis protein